MNSTATCRRLALTLAALGFAAAAAQAAPLSASTPAHVAPDSSTPILRLLPAGTEPQPAPADAASDTPANWRAISIAGPFELYVRNGDIDKGLQIKPGSALYQKPDISSPVLAAAEEGDRITITGLQGRWTQVELDKTLVAYIPLKGDVGTQPAIQAAALVEKSAPRSVAETQAQAAPETEAPATTKASTTTEEALPESVPAATLTPATYAPDDDEDLPVTLYIEELGPVATEPEAAAIQDSAPTLAPAIPVNESPSTGTAVSPPSATATPRAPRAAEARQRAALSEVKGRLTSTHRRFAPRRPYDWQLTVNDQRIAYLDFSKMQGTDQLARYARREVVVIGLLEPMADGQSYVIRVEGLRLQ